MYETILVTLDGTPTDRAIIEHVKQLAKLAHSRLVLLHVADGWAARTYGPDAVSPEIAEDTAYLEKVRAEFQAVGHSHARPNWPTASPSKEIIKWVRAEGLRSGGHEHAWTPLSCRYISRHHRHPGPAQYQRARSPSQGEVKATYFQPPRSTAIPCPGAEAKFQFRLHCSRRHKVRTESESLAES